MKRKKDLLDDVDLYVDPRRMTKEEELAISKFIQEHKKKKQRSAVSSKNKKAA